MGNYNSCRELMSSGKNGGGGKQSSKVTKVVVPSGEIRELNEPIKAAEVMLETPNFFLVNTKCLQKGCKFSALNADHDLEMGSVYVMFPMKRLNSIVTASDMSALFITAVANPKPKRQLLIGGESCKVSDYTNFVIDNVKLNVDDIKDFSPREFMHQVSMSKSKKPSLETIKEEHVMRGVHSR